MRRIYQTRFAGPDVPPEDQGNCFAACFASILDVDLADVDFLFPSQPDGDWTVPYVEYAQGMGLLLLVLHASADPRLDEARLGRCLAPAGLSIATGPSSTPGVLHSVVAMDGVTEHDPMPKTLRKADVPWFWHYMILTAPATERIPLVALPKHRWVPKAAFPSGMEAAVERSEQ